MTNLEAVKSTVGYNYPLEDNTYLKALIDADLEPAAEYAKANAKAVDLCAAALILTLLSSPDLREGSYQVSLSDRASLLSVRKALLAKHGVPDNTGPTVSGAPTYLW